MYDIIKSVIDAGRYELADMLRKIDAVWIQSNITDDQKEELVALARQKASPENSYAPWQEQITVVYAELAKLKAEIALLKNSGSESGEASGDTTEEYPEYVQPTGAHDAYNTGDKITYNGKQYVCLMDGCVWNPDTYPQGWKLAEDTV